MVPILVLLLLNLWNVPQAAAARHRPGPVFVRGTVTKVSTKGFSFVSPTKGTFHARPTALTTYWEKTKKVRPRVVQVGTHIGVHGYLSGNTLKAIRVTIYLGGRKTPPPETTLRGKVIKAGNRWIDVSYHKHHYHFVPAKGAKIEEALHNVRLASAKHGQRVDVRYYQSGHSLVATRILLLVIHVHRPRASTRYGTVGHGFRKGFVLVTIHGHHVGVSYRQKERRYEQVSVRGYEAHRLFQAEKVHKLQHLPVHTKLVRGHLGHVARLWFRLKLGKSKVRVELRPLTKVSAGSLPARRHALKSGKYVSVRFWRQGSLRIGTTIHIYAHAPIPTATGYVRGKVIKRTHGGVTVRSNGSDQKVSVPAVAHVTDGARRASSKSLRVGEKVLVRYYSQNGTRVATSIHIYAVTAHEHSLSGTVVSLHGNKLKFVDGPHLKVGRLSSATVIRNQSKTVHASALRSGVKIKLTATEKKGKIQVLRIDIDSTPPTGGSGHLTGSFRGTISKVRQSNLALSLSAGGSVRLRLTSQSRVVVSKRTVPTSWLFSGPAAVATVRPGHKGVPVVRKIEFKPPSHSVSGDVHSRHGNSISVSGRTSEHTKVLLDVARMSDGKRSLSVASLPLGDYVHVTGFELPNGSEAALQVSISHPSIRASGLVDKVKGKRVEIVRSSGVHLELRFPTGLKVFSTKTNQWFRPGQIPLGSSLSIHGTQEAGWVKPSSGVLTLKSSLMHGTVSHLGPGQSLAFAVTGGSTVTVVTMSGTKISAGRQIIRFKDIEVGDLASIRDYVDANGGYVASSIDLHRKSTTRTGLITGLKAHSFGLQSRDGSVLNFAITKAMVVEDVNGNTGGTLANGQKVRVTGHIRPDGIIDATRVVIEQA